MATTHERGRSAEDEALDWYRVHRPSAKLLGRNFSCRGGEIDLIFEETLPRSGVELVFVEVRRRAAGSWVRGMESVDRVKLRRLTRAMEVYLARYRGPASGVRFDILASNGLKWEHWENAWSLDHF